jgi:hypothetical protein
MEPPGLGVYGGGLEVPGVDQLSAVEDQRAAVEDQRAAVAFEQGPAGLRSGEQRGLGEGLSLKCGRGQRGGLDDAGPSGCRARGR